LWQSDGSEADTVLVKDINPGPGFGGPTEGTQPQKRISINEHVQEVES